MLYFFLATTIQIGFFLLIVQLLLEKFDVDLIAYHNASPMHKVDRVGEKGITVVNQFFLTLCLSLLIKGCKWLWKKNYALSCQANVPPRVIWAWGRVFCWTFLCYTHITLVKKSINVFLLTISLKKVTHVFLQTISPKR